ncbi:DUF6549 family protein [Polaribacter sp.]|uniref:DUF6549 family protein n=1 Tax=Polaribacter sp. TaxID=1920175 RepID=UPI003F6A5444
MLKNNIHIGNFSWTKFVQICLIILLSVLLFNQCSQNAHLQQTNKQNQLALLDSVEYYKNKLGLEVAQKLAFKGTVKDLSIIFEEAKKENAQLKEAVKKFKKLASATVVNTITEIKEVPVPFEVKVPYNFERTFLKEDNFYSLSGTVNQSGINFTSLSFPNTQTLVVGKKKTGFLKTEYRVEVTNSNPYIKTNAIDNFTFTEKTKRFGIGVSFGFGVYTNGFFVGPSVNYNLIKF